MLLRDSDFIVELFSAGGLHGGGGGRGVLKKQRAHWYLFAVALTANLQLEYSVTTAVVMVYHKPPTADLQRTKQQTYSARAVGLLFSAVGLL
jgi:hypothetical protein